MRPTVNGNKMTISQLANTLIACADPNLMAQETRYLAALRKASSYELDKAGGTLWIDYNGSDLSTTQPLIEPLSRRELEVLRLIAQGFSNRQIGEGLFLALSTVKGHNRIILDKLQVQRRTEAVARARELNLL